MGFTIEDDIVSWIDRTKCHRTRPLKVLCLGPGRTGTDSMRVALKTLGFDECYHGYTCVMENPPDNHMWNQAMDWKLEGKGQFGKEQWDQLLGHCQAVTDLPCVLFSKELIETYPDAKVILTHPPGGFERWYQSTIDTIVALREDKRRDAFSLVNPEARLTRNTFFRSFDAFYQNDFRKNAKAVFDEHYANIRNLVPKENLLDYSVKEGWEPLVNFLDVETPKTPFPNGNDPLNFFNRFKIVDARRRRDTYAAALKYATLAAVGGVLLWQQFGRGK